ncbi:MAG TPA: hypothetical protein VF469_04380, partial [Kofleriaceae bacterium]
AMSFLQPLAACGVMAAVVGAVRAALVAAGVHHPAVLLVAMIAVGAAAYAAAALVLCRATARDLLGLVKQAMRRSPAE